MQIQVRNNMVKTLYSFFVAARRIAMALAIVFNYKFCLRTKSEGLQVFKGEDSYILALPENLPHGLWINGVGNAAFRMRRRKHRLKGSLLLRTCICQGGEIPCFQCAFKTHCAGVKVGEPVWQFFPERILALQQRCFEGFGL